MRAAVIDRFGGPEVVHTADVANPHAGPRDVVVRVHAAAVASADARIRGASFPKGFGPFARLAFGVFRPRRSVLGSAFSGVVESVGARVEGFAPGDAVCGMTGVRFGAHAELVALPAARLVHTPAGVTHDDAAGVLFGGTTALWFLRDKAHVARGRSVLVVGASGAVGTNAVQLARHFGATVTGVTSGRNADLVLGLGAVRVVDHTTEPVEAIGERFDVVFDTVGALTIESGRRLLAPGGKLLLAVATLGETIRARRDVAAGAAPERTADMDHLLHLVATGDLRVVQDGPALGLDDIAEAHRRVDSGRKVGNLLVHP